MILYRLAVVITVLYDAVQCCRRLSWSSGSWFLVEVMVVVTVVIVVVVVIFAVCRRFCRGGSL